MNEKGIVLTLLAIGFPYVMHLESQKLEDKRHAEIQRAAAVEHWSSIKPDVQVPFQEFFLFARNARIDEKNFELGLPVKNLGRGAASNVEVCWLPKSAHLANGKTIKIPEQTKEEIEVIEPHCIGSGETAFIEGLSNQQCDYYFGIAEKVEGYLRIKCVDSARHPHITWQEFTMLRCPSGEEHVHITIKPPVIVDTGQDW